MSYLGQTRQLPDHRRRSERPAFAEPASQHPMLDSLGALPRNVLGLEAAIAALAVLRSRFVNHPQMVAAMSLIRRADAVLSCNPHCTQRDFLALLCHEAQSGLVGTPRWLAPAAGYVSALEAGLSSVTAEPEAFISAARVRAMHTLLTGGRDVRGRPGEFRRDEDVPGMARRPRAASKVLPQEIEAYLNDVAAYVLQPPQLPLALRICLVWGQLSVIRPFDCGNHELACIVSQMMLTTAGLPSLPLATYSMQELGRFEAAVESLRSGAGWEAWLDLSLDLLTAAANEVLRLLDVLLDVRAGWEQDLLGLRRDAAARQVVDLLLSQPAITVANIQRSLDMSFQTANAALHTLAELGIVKVAATDQPARRNRVFVAHDIIHPLVAAT